MLFAKIRFSRKFPEFTVHVCVLGPRTVNDFSVDFNYSFYSQLLNPNVTNIELQMGPV